VKIAIFGAGAVGGYMGARLAQAGEDVTLIARGPHLAALQQSGLRLIEGEAETTVWPRCLQDTRDAGPQDCVIVGLKAHQYSDAVPQIQPLLGPETPVVNAQNGVPWWYFYGVEGPYRDRRVESVDPGGRIWDGIGPQRAIGCVVYPACSIEAPGVIRHVSDDRFILGEPDGSRSERVAAIARTLIGAGLRAPVRTRIRADIWVKLWGNAVFNPVSALTRASLQDIATDPATRAVVRSAMLEVEAVANALGEKMAVGVDARIDGAGEVGEHKTSMLQDLEAGRALELDALTGAVVELAHLTGVEAPYLEMLYALVSLLAAKR
jgi:2-dehydropantoate 2-reductase